MAILVRTLIMAVLLCAIILAVVLPAVIRLPDPGPPCGRSLPAR